MNNSTIHDLGGYKTMGKVYVDLNKLRAYRAYKGITRREMSTLLGFKSSSYNNLENGKVDFTIGRLNEVCKILNIDPIDILCIEEDEDEQD